jgi:hypothetical protein
MQITRSSIDTGEGAADWFTGDVYVDPIAAPSGSTRVGAAPNRFMAHVAIQQVDENGSAGTFGEPVTDAQYGGAPVGA